MTREPDIAPAPHLTPQGSCSECKVRATLVNGEMKICPRCYALLWHRDWSQDEAARAVQLTAQRLHAKTERERQRQERKAGVAKDQLP